MPKKLAPAQQRVNRRLLRMHRLVSAAVEHAVQSLCNQSVKLASEVVAGDDAIDAAEVHIEQECIDLMVGMDAEHIRYMICLIKVNNELERVADRAVNIAERLPNFVAREAPPLPADLRIMANSAAGMLRDAMKAWVAQDSHRAAEVMMADEVVDALYDRLADDLGDRLITPANSSPHYLEYLLAARDFERIADHATNIAECVMHAATGRIVRHQQVHF